MQPSVKRGKSEWMQVMSGAIFALDWLKKQHVCSDWLKQVARKLKPIRKASKHPNKTTVDDQMKLNCRKSMHISIL